MQKLFTFFVFISIISFGQKVQINSKVTMNDGRMIETKIPFRVSMIDSTLVNILSIVEKKVVLLENGKKIKYPASEIKKIEFTDLKNKSRIFVHIPDYQKTLVEQLYDGKISWYRGYYTHGFDGSVQQSDILYKNDIKQVLSIFVNNRKKLKELMADKPELESLIENINYNRLKEQDLIDLLKKYDE